MDWRSGTFWTRAGYVLTAAWILGILLVTGGEMDDPLFDYIFLIPLGTWILCLAVIRLIRRFK